MNLGKISVIELVDVHPSQIHFRASSDAESLVDTAKRHAVDFVWTGNKKEARCQLLEEHHTLTPETSSKKDEDGAR